jgi:hypothetical protein
MASRLGWCVFVFTSGYQALRYGRRWDFGGPFGLPRALLSPDDRFYADGSPLDPLTLAVVRSGHGTEITAAVCACLALLVVLAAIQYRALARNIRRLAAPREGR